MITVRRGALFMYCCKIWYFRCFSYCTIATYSCNTCLHSS